MNKVTITGSAGREYVILPSRWLRPERWVHSSWLRALVSRVIIPLKPDKLVPAEIVCLPNGTTIFVDLKTWEKLKNGG